MKVTVLIDNNPHPEQNLLTEHGLSIYFEADGFKWLLDVGASGQFIINAQKLGVDISAIDFLILSHGHSDHTGGLENFLKINKKAKIFLSSHVKNKIFISTRRSSKRDITMDHSLLSQFPERFTLIKESFMAGGQVGIISDFPKNHELPKGNSKLLMVDSKGERPDDFKHEIATAVNLESGIVLFSGCSHNGVLNILDGCSAYFGNRKVSACIGGTHLIDSDLKNTFESESEISNLGNSILHRYPDMQLITGHCTGAKAQKILSGILNENFQIFHSGATFTF